MSAKDHKKLSRGIDNIKCAIITTSDTKTVRTDISGKFACKILTRASCEILIYKVIKNNKRLLINEIKKILKSKIDLIITTGGTGIGKKDISVEVVEKFISKKLEGFGELFRLMSFREIGTATIMSRALLGVTLQNKLILCIPGSPSAVKLALKKITVPELRHIVWELRK